MSQGDQKAFDKLYEATHRKLYGVVLRILVKDALAEEILQEVYLKIWHKAADFDAAKASPITWMATIARNRAIDEIRKREHDAEVSDTNDTEINQKADASLSLFDKTHIDKEVSRLNDCLGQLEPPKGDMVVLAYLDGLSREELAQRFAQPLGTIKTWLHRTLAQLKSCMAS